MMQQPNPANQRIQQTLSNMVTKTKVAPCKICEMVTADTYNGSAVCIACRKFFLRNQTQLDTFTCLTGRNDCDVSRVDSGGGESQQHWPRKHKPMCRRCRLVKAFEVGLLPREMIVIENYSQQRPSLTSNGNSDCGSDNNWSSSSNNNRNNDNYRQLPPKRRWCNESLASDYVNQQAHRNNIKLGALLECDDNNDGDDDDDDGEESLSLNPPQPNSHKSTSNTTTSTDTTGTVTTVSQLTATTYLSTIPPPRMIIANEKYTPSVQAHFEFVLEAYSHLKEKFLLMPVISGPDATDSTSETWNWLSVDFEVTSRVILEYVRKLPELRKQIALPEMIFLRKCYAGLKALAVTSVIKKRSFLSSFERVKTGDRDTNSPITIMQSIKIVDDCVSVMESAIESLKPSMSELAILMALFVYQAVQEDLTKDKSNNAPLNIEASIAMLEIALDTFVVNDGFPSDRVSHLKQVLNMMSLMSAKWQMTISPLLQSNVPPDSLTSCKKLIDTFTSSAK